MHESWSRRKPARLNLQFTLMCSMGLSGFTVDWVTDEWAHSMLEILSHTTNNKLNGEDCNINNSFQIKLCTWICALNSARLQFWFAFECKTRNRRRRRGTYDSIKWIYHFKLQLDRCKPSQSETKFIMAFLLQAILHSQRALDCRQSGNDWTQIKAMKANIARIKSNRVSNWKSGEHANELVLNGKASRVTRRKIKRLRC